MAKIMGTVTFLDPIAQHQGSHMFLSNRSCLIFMGFLALFILTFAPPASAQEVEESEQVGIVVDIVSARFIGSDTSAEIYPSQYFKVRLRAKSALDENGKLLEFDADLSWVFDTHPKRIFVVLDSLKSKRVIHWTNVREFFCIDREDSKKLDLDGLNLSEITIKGGREDTFCFMQ